MRANRKMNAVVPVIVFVIFVGCILAAILNGGNYEKVRILDCSGDKLIKVIDGDTIVCRNKRGKEEKIRILGINTPETAHKEIGITESQPYGLEAARLAEEILMQAEQILVLTARKDKYERTLGHVFVDEKLFGLMMINVGLAYETVSRFGDNGFSGLAAMIVYAAEHGPKPQFEDPSAWRKKHQK